MHRLEEASNLIQMTVAMTSFLVIVLRSSRKKEQIISFLAAAGYFCGFLGNVFWSVFLIMKGYTPSYFSACDIAWLGGFLFFAAAQRMINHDGKVICFSSVIFAMVIIINTASWIFAGGRVAVNIIWGAALIVLAVCTGSGIDACKKGYCDKNISRIICR